MSDLAETLVATLFGCENAQLQIGGVSATRLAEQYGTPLFAYDSGVINRKLASLRAILPTEFKVFYSIKANPTLAVVSHLVRRECGLEIASAGEFRQALAAGCLPEDVLFAGPAKSDSELELALSQGIGEIHVESRHEATRIGAISNRLGICARVAVRVNPSGDAQGGAMRMGGKPAPFGVDEEQLDPLVDYLVSNSCFDFRGIHIFAGTQILDYSVLLAQYRKGIEIARSVAAKIQRPLRTVDFGGGLGIPYFAGDRELDLLLFGKGLAELVGETRHDPAFAGTRFVLEPGRFLVGDSGIYITRIVDIKESRGKKFLIVDGGMNHHLAASGNLGQTIKRNYPIVHLQKIGESAVDTVEVVGPLCTPLDTLGRSVRLPVAQIGDLIGVLQSGAYARSASPIGFLSHPGPAEAWIDRGQHCLVRFRGRVEDYMRDVCPSSLDDSIRTVINN